VCAVTQRAAAAAGSSAAEAGGRHEGSGKRLGRLVWRAALFIAAAGLLCGVGLFLRFAVAAWTQSGAARALAEAAEAGRCADVRALVGSHPRLAESAALRCGSDVGAMAHVVLPPACWHSDSPSHACACSPKRWLPPIAAAAYEGHAECVLVLLKAGASVNEQGWRGRAAVHGAARYVLSHTHTHTPSHTITHHHTITPSHHHTITPSHSYTITPHSYTITPSHYAHSLMHPRNRQNLPAVVDTLVAHGVDLDAATWFGHTALHVAAGRGHEEVAKALLKHGANPAATNLVGDTPLLRAARSSKSPAAVMRALLADGHADVHAADLVWNTGVLAPHASLIGR
jgi:hypothetical protein